VSSILLVGAFALVQGNLLQQAHNQWEPFKLQHQKEYDHPSLESVRKNIFVDNALHIANHNERFEKGLESYTLEMNQHGDLLPHEFTAFRKGLKRSSEPACRNATYFQPSAALRAPSSVDWRNQGCVSKVKNQGECGSCYAFSATGSLEGILFKKTGKMLDISEQNIVDCSNQPGKFNNAGCDGGFTQDTFDFIRHQGGVAVGTDYPYKGKAQKCAYRHKSTNPTVKGWLRTREGNENELVAALTEIGPITVAMHAGVRSLMFYKNGVFSDTACKSKNHELDHAVLAVGFGRQDGKDFWLIKNSWGPTWGEGGYIKIHRNANNMCGIATDSAYPVL